jgi:hypothetical protein
MATRFDVRRGRSTGREAANDLSLLAVVRAWRLAARAAIVLTLALGLTSCVRVYTADPIKARVVDSLTGAPIEGVNVLAAWEANGGLEGGNITGYVEVMEDVTNANGEFSFPGWGPKVWLKGAIRDGAPLLILLKPGYEVSLIWEDKYGVEFAPSHLSSSWNGKDIRVNKFASLEEEYSQRLSGLATTLNVMVPQADCAWRAAPRFLKRVDELRSAIWTFPGKRVLVSVPSLEQMHDNAGSVCGSLKAYVLEHAK